MCQYNDAANLLLVQFALRAIDCFASQFVLKLSDLWSIANNDLGKTLRLDSNDSFQASLG